MFVVRDEFIIFVFCIKIWNIAAIIQMVTSIVTKSKVCMLTFKEWALLTGKDNLGVDYACV